MSRNIGFMSLALAVFAATMPYAALPSSARSSAPQDDDGAALLDKHYIAILAEVFQRSGYEQQDAANAAVWCVNNHLGIQQAPFIFPAVRTTKEIALNDPNSHPLFLLSEAFQATGWSQEESNAHALYCLYSGDVPQGGIASNCVVAG